MLEASKLLRYGRNPDGITYAECVYSYSGTHIYIFTVLIVIEKRATSAYYLNREASVCCGYILIVKFFCFFRYAFVQGFIPP